MWKYASVTTQKPFGIRALRIMGFTTCVECTTYYTCTLRHVSIGRMVDGAYKFNIWGWGWEGVSKHPQYRQLFLVIKEIGAFHNMNGGYTLKGGG